MKHTIGINELKENIPFDVKVRVNSKLYDGRVYGRLLDFPEVDTPIGTYEFSWNAVARAYYSTDNVLIVS